MYGNLGFEIKMLLIVVAGINALIFHSVAYQSVGKWDNDPVAPLAARAAALPFQSLFVVRNCCRGPLDRLRVTKKKVLLATGIELERWTAVETRIPLSQGLGAQTGDWEE